MQSIYFSLPAGLILRIISAGRLKFNKRAHFLARAYVPGIVLLNTPQKKRADIIIEYKPEAKEQMSRRGNRITICGRGDGEFPLDLWHLAYSAVRILLLRRDLYTVHAACVDADGYILIVGHSGVGKTSIILQLARERDLRIFSGNKTVLSFKNGGASGLAGTPVITMRGADFKKYSGLVERAISYGDRRALLLDEKKYTGEPARIRAIAIVRLNDGVKECDKVPPVNALHKLYPYFMDTVNADTIVCGGKDVFVGTPPFGAEKILATNLGLALRKIPVYSISGSLPFVSNSIAKI